MKTIFALITGLFFVTTGFALAANNETMTIATYYPSPTGVYVNLRVHRSVTFMPQNNMASLTNNQTGDLVYSDADDKFMYYNGNAWVALGSGSGGGGTMIYRSCAWGSDNTTGANSGWGNQCSPISNCCTPAACPDAVNWTDLGTNVEVNSISCPATDSSVGCRWNSASSMQHPVAVGRIVRICEKKS
jgi:hypothetical protein